MRVSLRLAQQIESGRLNFRIFQIAFQEQRRSLAARMSCSGDGIAGSLSSTKVRQTT
jgi:hypothetical protein